MRTVKGKKQPKSRLSGGQRLLESFLIFGVLTAIFITVALLSFDPADPSWSQTAWEGPVQNKAGALGALVADTLFFTLGSLAYLLPAVILLTTWILFRRRSQPLKLDYMIYGTRLLGLLVLFVTSCGLADLNFDDIWYFSSGGVIGDVVANMALPLFNLLGATLVLMFVWAVGFTLFTGISWLTIVDTLGESFLAGSAWLLNKIRSDKSETLTPFAADIPDEEQTAFGKHLAQQQMAVEQEADADDILLASSSRIEIVRPGQSRDAFATRQEPQFASESTAPAQQVPASAAASEERVEPIIVRAERQRQAQAMEPAIAPAQAQAPVQPQVASPAQTQPVHAQPAAAQSMIAEPATVQPAVTPAQQQSATVQPVATQAAQASADMTPAVQTSTAQTSVAHASPSSSAPAAVAPVAAMTAAATVASAPAQAAMAAQSAAASVVPADMSAPQVSVSEPAPDVMAALAPETVAQSDISAAQQPQTSAPVPEADASHAMAPESESMVVETVPRQAQGMTIEELERALDLDEDFTVDAMNSQAQADEAFSPASQPVSQPATQPAPQPVSQPTSHMASQSEAVSASTAPAMTPAEQTFTPAASTPAWEEDETPWDDEPAEHYSSSVHTASATTETVTMQPEMANSDMPNPEIPNSGLQGSVAPRFDALDDEEMFDGGIDDDYEHNTPVAPAQTTPVQAPYNAPIPAPQVEPHAMEIGVHDGMSELDRAQQGVPSSDDDGLSDEEAFLKKIRDAQKAQAHAAGLDNPFLMRRDEDLPVPTSPMPTLDLLAPAKQNVEPASEEELKRTAMLVESKLADYKIKAKVVGVYPGPVITRYELDLAPGVKVSRISGLAKDLARALSASAVRVVEVIPGKPYIGLELPNVNRETVYMSQVVASDNFQHKNSALPIVLGYDIAGEAVVADLSKMPHLLVAGTTGSGKSVGVNVMILSLLYKCKPEDCRFIMIDPKMLELSIYEGIPHLLTEVVTDMKDASNALRWCVGEMERRYKLMAAVGVRNLAGFNAKLEEAAAAGYPIHDPLWRPGDSMDEFAPLLEKMPSIVVIVDEFADMMMVVGKKVEELIARLAQKARAAGIHLVLATQRPSVDVITGLIKANIPSRMAFTVSTKTDSRTILDQGGAESLLGMGDMLYLPAGQNHPIRVHGAFASDDDVHNVVNDWKARGKPQYIEGILEEDQGSDGLLPGETPIASDDDLDQLFDEVAAFVAETRRGSVSGVQRKFKIGYNRAARIVEQLEAHGIVSPPGHNGNREVLAPPPVGRD